MLRELANTQLAEALRARFALPYKPFQFPAELVEYFNWLDWAVAEETRAVQALPALAEIEGWRHREIRDYVSADHDRRDFMIAATYGYPGAMV